MVFVYDVTKHTSFESLPSWIDECDRHSLTRDLPRILVGNKCDMKDAIVVNTHQAQRFADNHNMPLFETSAKDDSQLNHVESIFMTLAHKLKSAKHMMPPGMAGDGIDVPNGTVDISEVQRDEQRNNSSNCFC